MEVIIHRGLLLTSTLRRASTLVTNNSLLSVRCLCCADSRYWIIGYREHNTRHGTALRNYFLFSHNNFLCQRTLKPNVNKYGITLAYSNGSQKQSKEDDSIPLPNKDLSILKKMKQLTKDYWHILIPVHLVTSAVWVMIFYSLVKNGVDVVGCLEKMSLSEKYIELLRSSGAGDFALTYALYKVFTPARYAVTIGGTTMSIRYLSKLGYLKASSIKKAAADVKQSKKSTTKHKTEFKNERHTDPPKT